MEDKKKKLSVDIFAFLGIMLWLAYTIISRFGERFVGEIPDVVAYPCMIVSCVLMMIGIARTGYKWGKCAMKDKE